MSTLEVKNLTDRTSGDSIPSDKMNSMTPIAGVLYDQSVPQIDYSINVSSMSDISTGLYAVNMTAASKTPYYSGSSHREPALNAAPGHGDDNFTSVTLMTYYVSVDNLSNVIQIGELA